jgi:dTDP-4-dehydrorhamnose reductase
MSLPNSQHPPLELWAGTECTVNRVGDEFFDQLERTGHANRVSDLDLFAQLGIKAMRYPVLWERTAPNGPQQAEWSWADERLERLRELGIRPIVGLVHHGSGPRHTSLIDPAFPEGLAEFARAVAERYPWVDSYTPVNEPLTTARFSGMYGHWYPHGRDNLTFARALLTQCRAVVLAMRAIREVNPAAQLVQTDDLGKTFSTPMLAYQAELENERRWLTFDLLCGRLVRNHPMWQYLHQAGIDESELEWFLENPCPPDVIGINHYLSSERFLDEHLERYPEDSHGGNEKHRYADVLAVRVCANGVAGPRVLLQETWERYQLPIAVTEAHNGCTREEQMRWFMEVWQGAQSARDDGADVRAVTAWSLLGAYDWNTLVTSASGHYEPGVFDLRGPRPRPTAMADMLRDLATGREPSHPVLAAPGWWRHPKRLIYGISIEDDTILQSSLTLPTTNHGLPSAPAQPLLITGATGTLGRAFASLCELRGLPYHLLSRKEMDIANAGLIDEVLDALQPWAVINTAGYVRVDDAENDAQRCYRENNDGPAMLATACAKRHIQFLTFSSDLVFDGTQRVPYVESDAVAPLNVYGDSKAEAERQVLELLPSALVVRTSAFFGPWDEYNFVTIALRVLAAGETFIAADDAMISPTYVPDLVHASLDLLIDGEQGIWHLANIGATTWADLARRAAELAGVPADRIKGVPIEALGLAAQRPLYSVLGSERGLLLPSLDNALSRYLQECQVTWDTGRSVCV